MRVLSDEHKAAIIAGQIRGRLEREEAAAEAERARHRARNPYAASHPDIKRYRIEKKRYDRDVVAPAIREAKKALARMDEANALARRGGRPKKVVPRG